VVGEWHAGAAPAQGSRDSAGKITAGAIDASAVTAHHSVNSSKVGSTVPGGCQR
jgi:hypothetical protein